MRHLFGMRGPGVRLVGSGPGRQIWITPGRGQQQLDLRARYDGGSYYSPDLLKNNRLRSGRIALHSQQEKRQGSHRTQRRRKNSHKSKLERQRWKQHNRRHLIARSRILVLAG